MQYSYFKNQVFHTNHSKQLCTMGAITLAFSTWGLNRFSENFKMKFSS